MPDTELLLSLAEIAGVFVGFGALISVRSGGAGDAFEVSYMRGVVSFGLLTIVAALAPVTLGRYDLAEHQVWALSSVVVLAGLIATNILNASTPEYRDETAAFPRSRGLLVLTVVGVAVLMLAAALAPIVIILDLAPGAEAALFFTAVVVILLFDALQLLRMVFRRRHPATAWGIANSGRPARERATGAPS